MVKSSTRPNGIPIEVLDGIRQATVADRPQYFKDFTMAFYGYNGSGAKISEGVRENFVLQGLQAGIKGLYDCVAAFSETDFTEDLKKINVPTLVLHGDADQIVPFPISGQLTAKLVKNATLKVYPGFPTACVPPRRIRLTGTYWRSSSRRAAHRGTASAKGAAFTAHNWRQMASRRFVEALNKRRKDPARRIRTTR
jgi:hypothetical protein